MPVIRLNRVVLPAPFGPMIALRSPGMILNVTSRTALRPPKLFDKPRSSRAGSPPLVRASVVTPGSAPITAGETGAPDMEPRQLVMLIAVLAGWEVAAVD